MWCRSDSKNGYTCAFQVYTGKQGDSSDNDPGARVIKDLSQGVQGKNYFLIFDNFSSPTLLADLMDSKTYCVATAVATRKEFPKFDKSLKRGQDIAKQVTAKKVQCFV